MAMAPALLLGAMACGAIALTASGLRMVLEDRRLRARVTQVGARSEASMPPLVPQRFLATSGSDRIEIQNKLHKAGYFKPNALQRFVTARFYATAGMAALTFIACALALGSVRQALFPGLAAGGLTFIGAKYALQALASKRELRLTIEFPFLLDLMLMMIESGVSLDQCFRSIAQDEGAAIPHHQRLIVMLVDDLERGMDYHVAFERWAERVAVNGSRELAGLFRQSMFQGLELNAALREFIREFSQRRIMRAREAIGKITVRMVLFMLVFFMPALFIVLAGPPVTTIFDTLGRTMP